MNRDANIQITAENDELVDYLMYVQVFNLQFQFVCPSNKNILTSHINHHFVTHFKLSAFIHTSTLHVSKDIVEISHVKYRKLDELKCDHATFQNNT